MVRLTFTTDYDNDMDNGIAVVRLFGRRHCLTCAALD